MKFNLLKTKIKSLKNKEKSHGRSMVEMLGVLAIIGVLSIGGISGYTIAMRRYKANEILQVANKYALTIYTQAQNLMLNDPKHYFINADDRNYWTYWSKEDEEGFHFLRISSDNVIDFSDSGLGGMPNGLEKIELKSIVTNNSGDLVVLELTLTDNPLCQTIFTLTGNVKRGWISECRPSNMPNDTYGRRTLVTFIMN